MPDKIKSKDLHYDSSLPPFLQRLHDQSAGRGDTDRHERAIARPRKAKDLDADDGPTVVDESGETMTTQELEELQRTSTSKDSENIKSEGDLSAEPLVSGAIPDGEPLEDSKRATSVITDGVALKKRKAAKVIGDSKDSTNEAQEEDIAIGKVAKKVKKKAKTKPVKLTFDEDEGT